MCAILEVVRAISINAVFELIGRVSGRQPAYHRLRTKGDMRHTYADTSLAQVDLGFNPKVPLQDGLAAEQMADETL